MKKPPIEYDGYTITPRKHGFTVNKKTFSTLEDAMNYCYKLWKRQGRSSA